MVKVLRRRRTRRVSTNVSSSFTLGEDVRSALLVVAGDIIGIDEIVLVVVVRKEFDTC